MEYARTVSANQQGTSFARHVKAVGLSNGSRPQAISIATQSDWKSSPEVELVLKAEVTPIDVSTGSAVIGYGVASDIIQLVRGKSILAALTPRMSRVPFRTYFGKETSGSAGAWISSPGTRPI